MLIGRILCSLVVAPTVLACAVEADAPRGAEPAEPDPIIAEVRQRCADFAARLCASAADCCESTGRAFSAESCASSFIGDFCGPASQVVGAHLATYHPESEEPCLAAWERAHATCVADWSEIIEIRRDVWAACKMVRGSVAVGRGCSTSSSCAQPEGPATARCLPDPITREPTCQVLELLGEGAECPFPLGDVSVCDTGLYCTTSERDGIGTCAPVVPEGEPCDPDVLENSECGLGSYCGLDDGVCHRATNFGGPSCTQGTECVSFKCDRVSGTCEEALPTAADLCTRGDVE
jgi:hypothetical protein